MGNLNFVEGSFTHRIFQLMLKKKALTTADVLEAFGKEGLRSEHIPSYMVQLEKKGLVVRGKRKVQSSARKCSRQTIWGLCQDDIDKKFYSIRSGIDDSDFLEGVKKAVFDIISNSPVGLVRKEILLELQKDKKFIDYGNLDYIYECLRYFLDNGVIVRSGFSIPAFDMPFPGKPGYVYGKDEDAVKRRIIELMPESVKKAYALITQSTEVIVSDDLKERFSLTDSELRMWFFNRLELCKWIKVYNYKQRKYYHSANLSSKRIEELASCIHRDRIAKKIVENTNIGRLFQEQSIYYFVMYHILKHGYNIRLNKDFPKNIPNWFNREDILKYTTVAGVKRRKLYEYEMEQLNKVKNKLPKSMFDSLSSHIERKYVVRERLVDVWIMDSEPIDYLVFVYDDLLKYDSKGFALSMKKDHGSHMIGKAGKSYIMKFIGCLNEGRTLDFKYIPYSKGLTPVLIMKNAYGNRLFEHARNLGVSLFWDAKMRKMQEFVNNCGFAYEKDLELSKLGRFYQLFEKYENHEDVVMGKCSVEELICRGELKNEA